MQDDLIRVLKQRREDVHRRIVELRAELAIQEGRADELEQIWKEAVAGTPLPRKETLTVFSPPRIAVAKDKQPTVKDLIIEVMADLEDAGFEGVERAAITEMIRKKAPKLKGNTIRVSLGRLLKTGRIERFGNLLRLRSE